MRTMPGSIGNLCANSQPEEVVLKCQESMPGDLTVRWPVLMCIINGILYKLFSVMSLEIVFYPNPLRFEAHHE